MENIEFTILNKLCIVKIMYFLTFVLNIIILVTLKWYTTVNFLTFYNI